MFICKDMNCALSKLKPLVWKECAVDATKRINSCNKSNTPNLAQCT